MRHYIIGQGRARFTYKAERIPSPPPTHFGRSLGAFGADRNERVRAAPRPALGKGAALTARSEGVSFYFEGSHI